jgi:hypothetical protein
MIMGKKYENFSLRFLAAFTVLLPVVALLRRGARKGKKTKAE